MFTFRKNLRRVFSECFQCVKEPVKEVGKNAVARAKNRWLAMCNRNLYDCIHVCLPHCTMDIFATGKRVNHEGEYGLEIPVNFHFYEPERSIELAKK